MSRLRIAVLTSALLSTVGSGFGAHGPYVVGPNVQVSLGQPNVQHYETQISADPERAGHLIACAYNLPRAEPEADDVVYVTFDGGKTWTHTLTLENSTDPSCRIGAGGVAFASSIHDVTQPDGSVPSFLNVRRSDDGGRTWHESPIKVNTRSFDRDYVTVDDSGGLFRGHVYVHG